MSIKSSSVAVGSLAPYSADVKWYAGGTPAAETRTVTSGEAAAKVIELAKDAEYGSVVATKNGTYVAFREVQSDGSTAATNTTDTPKLLFETGIIAENDVLVIQYIDVETEATPFVHIATCKDVNIPMSAETKGTSVQGQSTQLQKVGAIKTTMTLDAVQYDLTLITLACGDGGTDEDSLIKWTNAYHAFNTIGCIMGEEIDAAGVLKRKWFAYNATANNITLNQPVDDFYTEALEFAVDSVILTKFPTA
jgi:hypothetical protein